MLKPSLVRNYILLSIFVSAALFVFGFLSAHYVNRLQREKMEQTPPAVMAHIMDEFDSTDRLHAFKQLQLAIQGTSNLTFWLINQHGQVIASMNGKSLPFDWNKITLPSSPYETSMLPVGFKEKVPMGVVRLAGSPPTYLAFYHAHHRQEQRWLVFQLSMLISIVIASLLTFGAISVHLRGKSRMAEEVMHQMQHGNLGARFPVKKVDEVGRFMLLFNKMADEIEHLVEQTKQVEKSRNMILQELAHDLKTPVASLKSMLETLVEKGERIPAKLRDEFLQMSLEETNYFARLVDDLLLLARVIEPQYKSSTESLPWDSLVKDEIDKFNLQQHALATAKKITLISEPGTKGVQIAGDSHLLHRVFRNALTNAMAFAQKEVQVRVRVEDNKIHFAVRDDGPGFEQEILQSYGERRISRFINERNQLSAGLGSVIIKKVVAVHRGQVQVQNIVNSHNDIIGGELIISLPILQEENASAGA